MFSMMFAFTTAVLGNPGAYYTNFSSASAVLEQWTPQESCAHCSGSALTFQKGKDKDECTNMTASATTFSAESGMTHTTHALPLSTHTTCKTKRQVCSSGHLTWNPSLVYGNFSVQAQWFSGAAPAGGLETATGFIGLDADGNEASITMGFHGADWLGGNGEGPHRYQHGIYSHEKESHNREYTTTDPDISAGLHTYGLLWSKDKVEWRFDGRVVRTVTEKSLIPFQPMRLRLHTRSGYCNKMKVGESFQATFRSFSYSPLAQEPSPGPPSPPPLSPLPTPNLDSSSLAITSRGNYAVVHKPGANYSYRVQALSERLVRVERSGNAGTFEDRPTFLVVNRSWPGLGVHTSGDDEYNVTVATAGYAVRFEFEKNIFEFDKNFDKKSRAQPPVGDSCVFEKQGFDAVCASKCVSYRTKKYPNGKHVDTSQSCCKLCNGDAECRYWVWDPPDRMCYPLANVTGMKRAKARVFGGVAPLPPTPPSPPKPPASKDKLTLLDSTGQVIWQGSLNLDKISAKPSVPDPGAVPAVWAIRDAPRFVPPAWGATPAPQHPSPPLGPLNKTSGFDFSGSAVPDVYFFLANKKTQSGNRDADMDADMDADTDANTDDDAYATLRRDILALTGAIPMLPDYAYGLWFTWYHNYTQTEKVAEVEKFEELGLPLDVVSLDMDWRLHPCYPRSLTPNCSSYGPADEKHYEPNTGSFPDFKGFFAWAHKRNLTVFFNDHPMVPDPASEHYETSPAEIAFRWDGLTKLMDMGLDFWWFDCHWHDLIPGVGYKEPGVPNKHQDSVDYAAWGQYVFTSIMSRYNQEKRPGVRTMMLGCSNSKHPANHRTPVWWTGDNQYDALALAVKQTVDAGVQLKPYVHPDCAGHHGPGIGNGRTPKNPAAPYPGEVFARWVQFCSTGSVFRLHSDPALGRQPWAYGEQALNVSRTYMRMRRQLQPMLVSAGARAHTDGLPLVRRCDLEWPGEASAALLHSQYLLGDDLLVAPVDPFQGLKPLGSNGTYLPPFNRRTQVWVPPGAWEHAQTGQVVHGPATLNITSTVEAMPIFHRHGGMLVLASARPTLAAATDDWGPLSLDIFPSWNNAPEAITRFFVDTKEQARIVRETVRETASAGVLNEPGCRTQFRLIEHHTPASSESPRGTNVNIKVIIDAPKDTRCRSHVGREWTLRFHFKSEHRLRRVVPTALLQKNWRDSTVAVSTSLDVVSPATILTPVRGRDVVALAGCGAGQHPVGSAGPIVEVHVRQTDVDHGPVQLWGVL